MPSLPVRLSLDESEDLRKHVKQLISGQVRNIMREEMSGIVAGELAKIRLLQPNSPLLADLVKKEIDKAIHGLVMEGTRKARQAMHQNIQDEIRKQMSPAMASIKATIRSELIEHIRKMP